MRISFFKVILFFVLFFVVVQACTTKNQGPLPYLGFKEMVDGKELAHKIPPFEFISHKGSRITNKSLSNKVYITNFFFTYCPSICPAVTGNMLRIYEEFLNEPDVILISHALDPVNDTRQVLSLYAENLGVESDKWFFLTGSKDSIYSIAEEYFNVAFDDPDAPGGINHTGKIVLVDNNGHIRSFCEGTEAPKVDLFMQDVYTLIGEFKSKN